jgi:hypothetical protein
MAKAPMIKLATANATQYIRRRCSAMLDLPFVASVFLIRMPRSSSSEIVHGLGRGKRPYTAPAIRCAPWDVDTDGGNDQHNNSVHKLASIAFALEKNDAPPDVVPLGYRHVYPGGEYGSGVPGFIGGYLFRLSKNSATIFVTGATTSKGILFVVHSFGPDHVRLMSVDAEGMFSKRPERYTVNTLEKTDRVPTMGVLSPNEKFLLVGTTFDQPIAHTGLYPHGSPILWVQQPDGK